MGLLSSCGILQKQPDNIVVVPPQEHLTTTIIKPAKPTQIITPKELKYHVVTSENMEGKILDNRVLICTDWSTYLEVGKLNQDVLRYIRESNNLIEYYEEVVSDGNNTKED